MLQSVARPTARATATRSGYVCLSCRAKRHLATDSSPPTTAPDEELVKGTDLKSEQWRSNIESHLISHLRDYNRGQTKGKKLPPPQISITGSKKDGFAATMELDGKSFKTPVYDQQKMARAVAFHLEHVYWSHLHGILSEREARRAPRSRRSASVKFS